MARSTYVYVVLDVYCQEPIAGFTVKHELQTWLRGNHARVSSVWRIRDGLHNPVPTEVPLSELF